MSTQIYAPDYLRNQKDTQLHSIADMIEEQVKKIQKLQTIVDFYSAGPRVQCVVQMYAELDPSARKKIDNLMAALLDIKNHNVNIQPNTKGDEGKE